MLHEISTWQHPQARHSWRHQNSPAYKEKKLQFPTLRLPNPGETKHALPHKDGQSDRIQKKNKKRRQSREWREQLDKECLARVGRSNCSETPTLLKYGTANFRSAASTLRDLNASHHWIRPNLKLHRWPKQSEQPRFVLWQLRPHRRSFASLGFLLFKDKVMQDAPVTFKWTREAGRCRPLDLSQLTFRNFTTQRATPRQNAPCVPHARVTSRPWDSKYEPRKDAERRKQTRQSSKSSGRGKHSFSLDVCAHEWVAQGARYLTAHHFCKSIFFFIKCSICSSTDSRNSCQIILLFSFFHVYYGGNFGLVGAEDMTLVLQCRQMLWDHFGFSFRCSLLDTAFYVPFATKCTHAHQVARQVVYHQTKQKVRNGAASARTFPTKCEFQAKSKWILEVKLRSNRTGPTFEQHPGKRIHLGESRCYKHKTS